jgi:lipopolysaccharide/colanic/teichoic acid biosynthesis glycosyltransferase
MKLFSLKGRSAATAKAAPSGEGGQSYQDYVKDAATGLYVEEFFHEMLHHERRRKERSKQQFLLLLLEAHPLQDKTDCTEALKGAAKVLFDVTREIDLKGWYSHGSVIGVIFSELSGSSVEEARSSIQEKIIKGLQQMLLPQTLSMLTMTFHCFPEDGSEIVLKGKPDLKLYPDLQKDESHLRTRIAVKRAIDVTGSAILLLLTSPIMLCIAAAIKLTSKGPVLFKQQRVGQYGKSFTFLKFRSMFVNNDESIHKKYIEALITQKKCYSTRDNGNGCQKVYKIENDPRITTVGRFIRKTSLDEFPQFINVLLGDMSLVGPRPPIFYELECYDPWHRRRILEMKPGITGIWQVSGRSQTTFDEMVRLDLNYARNWSLLLDLKLLIMTPWVILTGKGGY